MFLEGCGKFRLTLHRKNLVRISVHRILQAEAVVEAHYIESLEHSCRRSQRTIKCISLTIKKVHIVMHAPQSLEKVYFFILTVVRKKLFTFLKRHHLFCKRKVRCNHCVHFCCNAFQLLVGCEEHIRTTVLQCFHFSDLAIQAAWKRIIYSQNLIRKHLSDNSLKNKTQ